MKRFAYSAIAAFAGMLSFYTLANASFSHPQDKVHTYGIQIGGASLDYKGADTRHDAIVRSYLYYNYHFMPNIAIELGLMGGDETEDWDCYQNDSYEWNCYNSDDDKLSTILADDFEYTALVLAIKGSISMSTHSSVYAKVGTQYYDYELSLKRNKLADEYGAGSFLEAGWEYRWDFGFGMNTGVQYTELSDAKLHSFHVGVSYQF